MFSSYDLVSSQLIVPSMLLETGIFASQAIWLWRVRHVRKEAKQAGKTYDEYVATNPSKKIPRSESSETVADVEACHEPANRDAVSEKPNSESKEKQSVASESIDIGTTPARGFLQKWRDLVLRPVPEPQS